MCIQSIEALDGMNKKFANPYMIFYPVVSRDGTPFPYNKVRSNRHNLIIPLICRRGLVL